MITQSSHGKVRARQPEALLPLEPIRDEHSYRQAIEILDRLFLLRREKSHDEVEYFRALAQIAYEYECSRI
jgi:antitoxin component HigA of HigAB toxin-antitoxin module